MPSGSLIVNVEVAIVREGRYLAIVRGDGEEYGVGWLGFPGGQVERERDTQDILERTARREVMEEVGLALDGPITYVESHTFAIGDEIVVDIVMLARAMTGKAQAVLPDEVAGLEWMTMEELLADSRTQPWTRESLRLADRKRMERGW